MIATLDRLAAAGAPVDETLRLVERVPAALGPAGREALGATLARLTAAVGRVADPVALAAAIEADLAVLPDPAVREALAVQALVSCLPAAAERLTTADLDRATVWGGLADVPRKIARYGVAGTGLDWLVSVATARVVGVGRLQFELGARTRDGVAAWGVHVPELGPLDPVACDRAFAAAVPVLRRLGGAPAAVWTCTSWLLDAALPGALGAGSNIARFASRFTVAEQSSEHAAEHGTAADAAVAKFVFGAPVDVARRTRPTSRLQRAVAERWRAGGHWTEPAGIRPVG